MTNNNNTNNNSAVGPDKKINARAANAKPPSGSRQVHPPQSSYHRERTDLPKSFASMPQIGVQSQPQKYQQQQQQQQQRYSYCVQESILLTVILVLTTSV